MLPLAALDSLYLSGTCSTNQPKIDPKRNARQSLCYSSGLTGIHCQKRTLLRFANDVY